MIVSDSRSAKIPNLTKMRKSAFAVIFLFVFILNFTAQESPKIDEKAILSAMESSEMKEAREHIKSGNNYFSQGIFDRAFRHYSRLVNMTDNYPALNYRAGISALYGGRANEALGYLLYATPDIASDYYLQLGKAYQAVLDYPAALEAFEQYNFGLKPRHQKRFRLQYELLQASCNFGKYAVSDTLPYLVKNMGPAVNSYFDEYAAVEFRLGENLFFTTRLPKRIPRKPVNRSHSSERVMESAFLGGVAAEALPVKKLESSRNMSVAGIDHSSQQLLIYDGMKHAGHLQMVPVKNDKMRSPKRLKGRANRKVFKEGSISVSEAGDAYFVSNRWGGEGGKDIWFAQKVGKRRYKKPENLGSLINTPFDEASVYVTPDGRTLYFASNGHPGLGGFDVFKSTKTPEGTWGEPVNLGYPVNSPGDDLFYFPTSNSLVKILASERPQGYGGLDLYLLTYDTSIPFTVWGEVTDVASGQILAGRITLFDDSDNYPVASVETDASSGEYYISMNDTGQFTFKVDVPGYRSASESLERPTLRYESIRKDFKLEKLLAPYTLWGRVNNQANGFPVHAEIVFTPVSGEGEGYRVFSDATTGYYSVTFEDKIDMTMEVVAKDYFGVTESLLFKGILGDNGEKNISLIRSRNYYTLAGIVSDAKSGRPVPARLTVSKPGDEAQELVFLADQNSGRFEIVLDGTGPFLLELNAEKYFFMNTLLHFHHDSTLMVRNFRMQPVETGARIVIENILFTTGQATLRAESYSQLNRLVGLLKENETIRIEVSGHTDNVGSAAVNKRLSRNRALAVKNYLETQGIEGTRIEFEGYGFDRPIAPNTTDAGRAANRRVEIEVIE
jgi:outer membrane protein OmpA-like peptidoglycan-associated protein